MSDPDKENATVIVASFQITRPLPNGTQLVVSGHFYNKDKPEDINRRIDDWMDASQRQHIRTGIEKLELDRKAHIDNLQRVREHYEGLVQKKQSGMKLKTQEMQQYDTGQATIAAALKGIETIEAAIADSKKKIGMTG